jgi:Cu/Ag efflux protein CusF
MTNRNKGTRILIGIAAAVLGGALLTASLRADQTMNGPRKMGQSTERTTRETDVVTGIDRSTRNVMLQNAEGERRTVKVPPDVKAFDTLKVGDRIDIEYYESLAVSVLPPGSKPSMSERSSGTRMGEGGSASRQREMTVAAEIVSIDVAANKVTFKGPNGQLRTVTAEDPQVQKRLPSLKPGQVVQFTYTEAVAASIRPAVPAPSTH